MNPNATHSASPKGIVLNIQHFCTHDGLGIRKNVFLKGCSLRCKWCSNPESIQPKPELAYNPGKCIGEMQCGFCLKDVCPESAIFVIGSGDRPDDKVRINWDLCTNCGKCVDLCPANALYLFGQEMTVEQVLNEVEQDASFYRESGGGITLSGGECTLQPEFSAALLAEAHHRGINTAIETAGVNEDEEHIRAVLAFIRPYKNVIDYELLPYHRFGEGKYGFLGRVYEMMDFTSPSPETLKRLQAAIDEAFSRKVSIT